MNRSNSLTEYITMLPTFVHESRRQCPCSASLEVETLTPAESYPATHNAASNSPGNVATSAPFTAIARR
jgi:hypothetical protein